MEKFIEEIKELDSKGALRKIHNIESKSGAYVNLEGKNLLNLSSNDYLSVAGNKFLPEEFTHRFKNHSDFLFSSSSARLMCGTSLNYAALEQNIAQLFNSEKALIFNTGFQCNLAVISTLFDSNDVIFCDKLNHASIIDGIRLSKATFYRYKHLDYEHLEELLKKHRNKFKNAVIISESIFSMDGDCADMDALRSLKTKYNSLLMIDEAHAFGVRGENLNGVSQGYGVDIVTATFGKALGSVGAFVASKKEIIDYLINKARPFIFSTSLPPINILWTKWLLEKKFEFLAEQKMKLDVLTRQTQEYLSDAGIKTPSSSHIIPIIIGDNKRTLDIADELKQAGYFVLPIRPPSVAPGSSRLRLSLCSDIRFEDIKKLVDIIKGKI